MKTRANGWLVAMRRVVDDERGRNTCEHCWQVAMRLVVELGLDGSSAKKNENGFETCIYMDLKRRRNICLSRNETRLLLVGSKEQLLLDQEGCNVSVAVVDCLREFEILKAETTRL